MNRAALTEQLGGLPLGGSPNGVATGLVLRRRTERLVYPTSAEQYAEEGFDPERWNPDGAGFWAKVVASLTGMDERNELQLRIAFYQHSDDAHRDDYYRELAWRVPEWGYATENDAGDVVPVPAPGEGDGNLQAFDLLPYGVGAWLVERVRTIHLPKRAKWETPSTTATPTPTIPSPETTPQES